MPLLWLAILLVPRAISIKIFAAVVATVQVPVEAACKGTLALLKNPDIPNSSSPFQAILDSNSLIALRQAETLSPSRLIPARLAEGIELINAVDILYVEAQDNRTFLRTLEDHLPTQFTLTELEKRLARSGFFRAHRSYLVNLQHVKEVIPYTPDTYILKLRNLDGIDIPLSKSAARELRELLDY